eukprot:Phypoly_transcript_11563.p1 GENE.Phypoly_transcript_11563~~Phypoly_transcript_11563.p1  ORF type:complete len:399 (+),score=66.26 Phypoly_transcript_11563:145-1197(+)
MGVMQKNFDAVKKLIDVCKEKGANLDLNKGTAVGETPLHFAACHNIPRAVEILIEAGANINVRSAHNATPYSMALENNLQNIVTYLRDKGADQTVLPKPANVPIISLPKNIDQGFLKDDNQRKQEIEFGGTLWEDFLEPFYFGKKPKDGETVEIAVNFKQPERHGGTFSWLRGIIHTVSEDKKTVVATVRLNIDHEGKIPSLEGEWEATLQLDYVKQFPWTLTKLVPNTNPARAYDVLRQIAKSLENQRGKKFVLAKLPDKRCWYLKGTTHEHQGHEGREVCGMDLRGDGTIEISFSDGEKEVIYDRQRCMGMMQSIIPVIRQKQEVRRCVQLTSDGAPVPWEAFLQMQM